ncbi:hypothetical protein SLEP1_g46635 [Rubroshorea leprosula]|uniref:Uncharacterized protein n=1 Tax=Rubroshorea leprosula TaxID=152421 RepID=A0AAV5LQJ5_9ROSI|nr:hypothetical protein SLEP1_g46635 [Rubroshorea leprosula]
MSLLVMIRIQNGVFLKSRVSSLPRLEVKRIIELYMVKSESVRVSKILPDIVETRIFSSFYVF